jgi:HAD superfamily hydrolase (TIGR01509 family)
MPALLFGSIGTVAETSELQRDAFNEAFKEHGLDWQWSQDEYRHLLEKSGGQDRIAEYARSRHQEVDAAAVYTTKSENFRRKLVDDSPAPRDGIAETVAAAKDDGFKVALVTTTSRANLEALAAAVKPALDLADFDLVVDKSEVDAPKPDAAVYEYAVAQLGEEPADCVAIENNLDGVSAAKAAGIAVVAYPGEDNADHDFGSADQQVDGLVFGELRALVSEGAER